VIYVIARGEVDKLAGKKVVRGTLTAAIIEQIMRGNYDPYDFYICGPKGYMKTIKSALAAGQVDPETIFSEDFAAGTTGWSSLTSGVSARVYASTAASMALVILMVAGIDLKSTLAKASVAAPTTTTSAQATTTPGTTTTPTTDTTTTPTTATTPTDTTTPTQTQTTYQQPVSTVS
jgi:hypothetical protein